MKIALIVGHKKSSQGARNKYLDISEWVFNKNVANDILRTSIRAKDITIVYRDTTYKNLPNEVNAFDPDFIISLHCNSFNSMSHGTETLYYHTSEKGKQIAQMVNDNIVGVMGTRDRGIKGRTSEDRGGYLLRYTHAPCVIAEPFFLSNTNETQAILCRYSDLISAYNKSIDEICNKLF